MRIRFKPQQELKVDMEDVALEICLINHSVLGNDASYPYDPERRAGREADKAPEAAKLRNRVVLVCMLPSYSHVSMGFKRILLRRRGANAVLARGSQISVKAPCATSQCNDNLLENILDFKGWESFELEATDDSKVRPHLVVPNRACGQGAYPKDTHRAAYMRVAMASRCVQHTGGPSRAS